MALKKVHKCTPTIHIKAKSVWCQTAYWESGRWKHSTYAFCLWCQTSYLALFFNCIDYIFWHRVHKSVEKPLSAHTWFLLVGNFSQIYYTLTASMQRGFLINKHSWKIILLFEHTIQNFNLRALGIWQNLNKLLNKWIKFKWLFYFL